jgi:PAT family beta-lactamase induction signal transducer AmpG
MYVASGLPYIVVMFVATDLYKTMGVSNTKIAFWTSLLYLPWVVKAFWSPYVDLFSTKRNWILWMQLALGFAFAGIALAMNLPMWFPLTLILFWVMALFSATHDISVDGYYMLALDDNKQAFFTGIRVTFYRFAMIAGLGFLVMLTGFLLEKTGLETQRIAIKAADGKIIELTGSSTQSYKGAVYDKPQILVSWDQLDPEIETGSDSIQLRLRLSDWVDGENEIIVLLGHSDGPMDIFMEGTGRFVFTGNDYSQWQHAVVRVKPNLMHSAETFFEAKSGNVPLAWAISMSVLGLVFILFSIYHRFVIPYPASDIQLAGIQKDSYWEIIVSFFRIRGIFPAIMFLLLYRFAEAQLAKMASPFLLDSIENGGLALSLTEKGFVYGTLGVLALVAGGILGGVIAARSGLKKWIWWMAVAINVPNLAYVYLSYFQPSDLTIVSIMIAIEQFGYGFGFTAYILFILFLVRVSIYKTAHYAIATGFMALGMMIPGMFSGKIQEMIGSGPFFIYVVICTIPAFLALWFVYRSIDPSFGVKRKQIE